jgi:hypothetical protein
VIPTFCRIRFSAFAGGKHIRNKKTGTEFSVAGFTTRSLMPLVTTLGGQFIASTFLGCLLFSP